MARPLAILLGFRIVVSRSPLILYEDCFHLVFWDEPSRSIAGRLFCWFSASYVFRKRFLKNSWGKLLAINYFGLPLS